MPAGQTMDRVPYAAREAFSVQPAEVEEIILVVSPKIAAFHHFFLNVLRVISVKTEIPWASKTHILS